MDLARDDKKWVPVFVAKSRANKNSVMTKSGYWFLFLGCVDIQFVNYTNSPTLSFPRRRESIT
jgi:hypothetical protein